MSEIVTEDYITVLNEIKQRIRTAQYKALRSVNKELISLYWDIGRTKEAISSTNVIIWTLPLAGDMMIHINKFTEIAII